MAEEWIHLAQRDQLGKLWPRVVHTATMRHLAACISHILFTAVGLVSAVVLLVGIQAAIASPAPCDTSSQLTLLIGYALALFAADITRLLLNSYTRMEARRAGESTVTASVGWRC